MGEEYNTQLKKRLTKYHKKFGEEKDSQSQESKIDNLQVDDEDGAPENLLLSSHTTMLNEKKNSEPGTQDYFLNDEVTHNYHEFGFRNYY